MAVVELILYHGQRTLVMKCTYPSCTGKVVAKGLCDKHRKRLARHGHLEDTRSKDWGEREKHPLYNTWYWIRRHGTSSVVPEWDDLWQFVNDVGERPDSCNIQRYDASKPYGPDNFYWKETTPSADKAKYAREWRKNNPLKVKNADLKKSYGIDLNEYMKILDAQGGGCKICGKRETGRYQYLPVDHDHKTGKIRGILCSPCNRAIGMFKDDPKLVSKAASYLQL